MARYFIETSSGLGRLFSIVSRQSQSGHPVDFKHFVPELPDILHSRVVLGQFRWKGSERLDATATERSSRDENCDEKKHEPAIGTTWCFLWRYRRVVLEILIFASAWIVFVFLSPLSMNLVSSVPVLNFARRGIDLNLLAAAPLRAIFASTAPRTLALLVRGRHFRRSSRDLGLLPERTLSPGPARAQAARDPGRSCVRQAHARQGRRWRFRRGR